MIITIDIGGTKTLWTLWKKKSVTGQEDLFDLEAPLERDVQPTAKIDDFVKFIEERTENRGIDAMCLALAGPVSKGKLRLTNTGQVIDLQKIRERFARIPHISFLNDLEALGYSIDRLNGSQLKALRLHREDEGHADGKIRSREKREGARTVLSIGTGLGISAVTREGIVLPTEGGHTDFAPLTERQRRIFHVLQERYGHVSYERLLSGQGLSNIYETLSGEARISPAEVSEKAADREAAALESFEVFSEILGAACGNFALTFLAKEVYLGGGMMPKILQFLEMKRFEAAFLAKGRFRSHLEAVPVYLITDEAAPSLGAAAYSAQLSQSATGL